MSKGSKSKGKLVKYEKPNAPTYKGYISHIFFYLVTD